MQLSTKIHLLRCCVRSSSDVTGLSVSWVYRRGAARLRFCITLSVKCKQTFINNFFFYSWPVTGVVLNHRLAALQLVHEAVVVICNNPFHRPFLSFVALSALSKWQHWCSFVRANHEWQDWKNSMDHWKIRSLSCAHAADYCDHN